MTYTVCLASVPQRVPHLSGLLDSLLAQQPEAPSRIVVTVPRTLSRPGEGMYKVEPAHIQWVTAPKYASTIHLRLVDEKHDYGPATKLLGCLPELSNGAIAAESSDDCVIVSDDDAPRPRWWAWLLRDQSGCNSSNDRRLISGGTSGSTDPTLHVQGNRGFAFWVGLVVAASLVDFYDNFGRRGACWSVDDQLFTSFFRLHNLSIARLCMPADIGKSRAGASQCRRASDGDLLLRGRYEGARGLRHNPKISGKALVQACYRSILRRSNATGFVWHSSVCERHPEACPPS